MASALFPCSGLGGPQFCTQYILPQSSCMICTAIYEGRRGIGTGIPVNGNATTGQPNAAASQAEALLSELAEPLNVIQEEPKDSDRNVLFSPYANTKTVSKMNCKFSKYGCRKNVHGQSLYEKHIQKCSYGPSNSIGNAAYIPPLVDDFLEPSFLSIDDELKWSASCSDDGSGSGSDWSEMDDREKDADVGFEDLFKTKDLEEIPGRQYLLGDRDPWMWTGPRLPSPHDSSLLIQRELGLLHKSKKKPEYMMALSKRLVQVCEEVVNSL